MLELDVALVDGEQLESGEWVLWASSDRGITASQLRMRLFAWHPRSLYGTLLKEGTGVREESLVLSPYDALDYFAAPGNSLHLPVEWSDRLKTVQHAAGLMREALEKGWYAPEAGAWQEGKREWKPLLPPGALQEQYVRLQEELLAEGIDVSRWFTLAVEELLVSEPAVRDAWNELIEEQPLLEMSRVSEEAAPSLSAVALDEEEWLTAVGWKKDEVPFRVGLQLVEPNMEAMDPGDGDSSEESAWSLRMLLIDKQNPNTIVEGELDGLSLHELAASFTRRISPAWEEHIGRKLGALFERATSMVPELYDHSLGDGRLRGRLTDDQAWRFLQEDSLKLLQAGFSVLLPAWWEELRRSQPRLKAQLKSSVGSRGESFFGVNQLMRFDWKVAIGELDFSEEEFARLTAEKKRLLYIRGRWIQLDPAFVAGVRQAMKRVGKKGLSFREVMELHLLGGDRNEDVTMDAERQETAMAEVRIEVELNRHMAELIGRLQHTSRIPIVEPPAALQAGLRNYQKEGVSWLLFLRRFGLGACLADDMGLGKTIQFIAYLLHARNGTGSLAGGNPPKRGDRARGQAPALLICPTSVLGNWQKELERFAPSLSIYLHYGPQRAKGESFTEAVAGYDLVLTSYNLAQLDEAELSSVVWDVIGLDEAQNIKNVHTKQSAAIRRFDALHRIALTGTPIENRLTELWSIFDFMNPGYLGSLSAFTHKYVSPIEKGGDPALVEQVQKLIRPFLLRRVKKDPAIRLDLPDKTETKAYVSLTLEQASLYENVVQDLMNRIDSLTGMEKRGLILAALTKLKQICNHPALFLKEPDAVTWEGRSGKVERLLELVQELREEGDSCLIFTQFVEMGHMLKRILERERGEKVYFLHGGVPKKQRDAMIARFQGGEAEAAGKHTGAGDAETEERTNSEAGAAEAGERKHTGVEAADADAGMSKGSGVDTGGGIFILSLKAGGTGLNLTAANHVFHFDRWWNPAVENQATDRAFRIGQTRNVQVHKFITLGTLEERIDEMIERKLGLSQQIVGAGENWVTEMTTDELRDLFALRREWVGK